MYCTNCGAECSGAYCTNCGEKQSPLNAVPANMVYPPVQQAARKESNTLGIIAFVVSLFALFFCMGEAKLTIATGIAAGLSISLTMAAFYMANRYHLRLGLTVTALVLSCLAMLFFV